MISFCVALLPELFARMESFLELRKLLSTKWWSVVPTRESSLLLRTSALLQMVSLLMVEHWCIELVTNLLSTKKCSVSTFPERLWPKEWLFNAKWKPSTLDKDLLVAQLFLLLMTWCKDILFGWLSLLVNATSTTDALQAVEGNSPETKLREVTSGRWQWSRPCLHSPSYWLSLKKRWRKRSRN